MSERALTGEDSRRAELVQRLSALGQQDSTATALFHQAAAGAFGLGITDMKALEVLVREGPQPAGQLAEKLHLTTGAVTSVIDRLARDGWVERRPDERDRRKVIVAARAEKLASGPNVYESIGRAFGELQAGYSVEELEFLARHYEASIEINRQQTAKLSAAEAKPRARRGKGAEGS